MQTEILRGNWSYDGYVVGDSDTVQYINTAHHYVNNPAAAVQAALHAGTDIESWTLGGGLDYYRDVIPTMYVFFWGGFCVSPLSCICVCFKTTKEECLGPKRNVYCTCATPMIRAYFRKDSQRNIKRVVGRLGVDAAANVEV